jgi:hypothetical protein
VTQWRKEMQTQEVPPGYDPVVPTKPKTKSVKRGMKERSKSGFRKNNYRFFRFWTLKTGPKLNQNRSVWIGFGSVWVPFFPLPVWLFFKGKNRTEQEIITSSLSRFNPLSCAPLPLLHAHASQEEAQWVVSLYLRVTWFRVLFLKIFYFYMSQLKIKKILF